MADARRPRKKAAPRVSGEMRRQAEEGPAGLSAALPASPVPEELTAAVDELRVHQIELETQNEELRRAQLELEEQREKYFELFDMAPVGFLTLSDWGIIGDANLTAAQLLGVERQLLVGQPFSDFILAADQDAYYRHRLLLTQSGKPQTSELRLRPAGGEPFWAHLESRPQGAAGREPLRYHLTFTDVHERVVADEALRTSEEKYRLLVDSASEAILVAQDGMLRLVNRMIVETTGFSEQELTTAPFMSFIHPDDRATVAEHYQKRLRGEAVPARYAIRLLTKQGSALWAEMNAVAIEWEGRPATLNFLTDISERRQVEELATQQGDQLRLLYEASQRLNRTLDLDDIYQAICDSMSIIAPHDSFFISAFDQETQLITCRACRIDDKWLDVSSFPPIPLEEEGRGTQSIVIRMGRSLLINDYQAQHKTARSKFYVDAETNEVLEETPSDEDVTRSALIVPLKTGGVVRGVMQVMSCRLDAYTEDQLRLLEALSLHIASAQQNALLYAQVQTELTERKQAEEALARSSVQLREQLQDTVRAMGAIVGLRDPYTAAHERRVTELATAIALELGLDEEAREGLAFAAEVHDVGKIGVPAEILSKPAALTDMEYALIKQHPQAGRELLAAIRFRQPVAEIVGQHQERLDGSGYPAGLKGEEIMLEARILAVADVVEAMASHRPYRASLGLEAALAEVRGGAGVRYDAAAVAACERVFAQGFVFTEA